MREGRSEAVGLGVRGERERNLSCEGEVEEMDTRGESL